MPAARELPRGTVDEPSGTRRVAGLVLHDRRAGEERFGEAQPAPPCLKM